MLNARDLSVQSWCFRNFKDLPTLGQKVREIGVEAIELCGVHADFGNEGVFDSVLSTLKQQGIRVVSIGVQGFRGDASTEEKWFRFAKAAGAAHISADFPLENFAQVSGTAQSLADKYDLRLGIHNHGGRHWLGSRQALRWALKQTSSRIGIMLDTAWALDAGEDPVALLNEFEGRITGLHLKDFTFSTSRKPTDVVVGTGNLDLGAVLAKAKSLAGNVIPVIEFEGDADNPVPALAECVKRVRPLL